MRPPSVRLTNRGNGRETVSIYPVSWTKDAEANPIKVVSDNPVTYPAVVTPQAATMTDSNGTTESTSAYQVMIYSGPDPGVTTETTFTWTVPIGPYGPPITRVLVAAGICSRRCPNSWVVDAMEVNPDTDDPETPYNLQQE